MNVVLNPFKSILTHNRLNYSNLIKIIQQSSTSRSFSSAHHETRITLTDDGSIIACWHPTQPISYKHTRPLPEINNELDDTNSVLKLQYKIESENIYNPEGPNTEELQMLTFTPKRRWTERKSKRIIPIPERPREGI